DSTTALTTTFGYRAAVNQLIRVTNPRGHASYLGYKIEHDWETAGAEDGWAPTSTTATVTQSTERPYTGTGSLKVNLDLAACSSCVLLDPQPTAKVIKSYSTPAIFNSAPQEFVILIYVPSTAPSLKTTISAKYKGVNAGWASSATLTSGAWNAVHVEDMQVDPAWPIYELGVQLRTASASEGYTGPVYLDHHFFKGITTTVSDAKAAHTVIEKFGYNWAGYTTTASTPDVGGTYRAVTYRYNGLGQPEKVINALGYETVMAYDSLDRLTQVTPPGSTSGYQLTYYSNNCARTSKNLSSETSRQGADTSTCDTKYEIDPRNEERRAAGQDYVATIYVRDAAGNATSLQTNRYAAGTDLEQGFPTPVETLRKTSYTYAAGGLASSVTDPRGNKTYFTHQSTNTGYLIRVDAPAGKGEVNSDGTPKRRVTDIVRNPDGTIQSVEEPREDTSAKRYKTTYGYDGWGRPDKVSYGMQDDTADFTTDYTLDNNGNLTAMTDNTGSSSRAYDENNRGTSESRTQSGVTRTAGYAYDDSGLMTSMTTFGGQTVSYAYDQAMRIVSQTDPSDGGRAIRYGYDARSRRTSVTFPSGVKQEGSYTGDRLELVTLNDSAGTVLQSYRYDYAANGSWNSMVKRITEADNSVVDYVYDELNRLSSATRSGTGPFSESYGYDTANNRTSITSGGTTKSATYDATNQMTNFGGVEYKYDRNGNLVGYSTNTLEYDAGNRWTKGSINGKSVAYGYDGSGRRISGTVGTAKTEYWHDASGLSLETGANSATYLRDRGGRLLSGNTGGATHNYARDRLGSVTGLVSTSGKLGNTYSYKPWGEDNGATGATYNPFQYTGTYLDKDTGQYQMGARYYDSATSRFSQMDPLGGGYAYANCNPGNLTDPTGLHPVSVEIVVDCVFALVDTIAAFAGIGIPT
ncbi:MAG: hypothetical protein M3P51_11110, partial [Chloroflexota bacterium]|nr:hypothetical protein [Chloroflexota bacterium]